MKYHLKRNYMTPAQLRKRTAALKVPEDIYKEYERICDSCEDCRRFASAPERSRVSGMRATNFGDL